MAVFATVPVNIQTQVSVSHASVIPRKGHIMAVTNNVIVFRSFRYKTSSLFEVAKIDLGTLESVYNGP